MSMKQLTLMRELRNRAEADAIARRDAILVARNLLRMGAHDAALATLDEAVEEAGV